MEREANSQPQLSNSGAFSRSSPFDHFLHYVKTFRLSSYILTPIRDDDVCETSQFV